MSTLVVEYYIDYTISTPQGVDHCLRVDQLWRVTKHRKTQFLSFSGVFQWFQMWNHWKRFEKKIKGWKKCFDQLSGWNTQHQGYIVTLFKILFTLVCFFFKERCNFFAEACWLLCHFGLGQLVLLTPLRIN